MHKETHKNKRVESQTHTHSHTVTQSHTALCATLTLSVNRTGRHGRVTRPVETTHKDKQQDPPSAKL